MDDQSICIEWDRCEFVVKVTSLSILIYLKKQNIYVCLYLRSALMAAIKKMLPIFFVVLLIWMALMSLKLLSTTANGNPNCCIPFYEH